MIIDILTIACGVLLAKLIIGLFNESYWYKWERVRLELDRLQRGRKRQEKEVEVPHSSQRDSENNLP